VEAYDGPRIVGMDLHRRRPVLVRMTEDGRKLGTVRITNSPARLAAEIRRAGLHPKVVLEACYGWYWAAAVPPADGAEVHPAHPLGVKAFSTDGSRTSWTPGTWPTCCGWAGWRRRGSPRRRSASQGCRGPGASQRRAGRRIRHITTQPP
jgi:hypothetical protein